MTDRSNLDKLLPLTPTAFHVLVALAGGPRHGYGVAQEVEELTEGRIVMGPGTLYGTLQRMLGSALIEEAENPREQDAASAGGGRGPRAARHMTPVRDIPRSSYRRLLGMYPRSFRDRYTDDLLQAFDDRRSEQRFAGTWGGVERIMDDFPRDLQFSARMLIKNPNRIARQQQHERDRASA
jgi:hypothetical protein